ncbi:MAG: acyl-CoA dehydrogenase family protein [Proteobacteria bacterium]|nr:acyl-CoA dehydrogenase family protein [Pseudomonadota bacterium]
MDFSFSDEQTLLQESIARFVANEYAFEARQRIIKGPQGYDTANWATFAELGWLALTFSEEEGGFGWGSVATMILAEQFGKGLIVEPFVATVILAGGVLRHAGSKAQKEAILPGIVDGSRLGALAYVEPQGRFNLADLVTTGTAKGEDYLLNGHKAVVLNGPSADFLVVSARTGGAQRDTEGVSLFLVEAKASGITRRDYPTVDGLRASEIMFENTPGQLIGEAGGGLAVLQQVIDEATLAIGAEAVGCMEVLYKATVEYCKTREQFGQPIGKFQVLQHRMVDMFMEYEQAKSLMFMAAMRLDEGYGPQAQKAVSAFKVQVGKSGRFVGQQAIQLHGGMGMTEELNVGHYFKRLTVIDTMFGNVDYHLKRFGAL